MKRVLVFLILLTFTVTGCGLAEERGGMDFRLHGYVDGTLLYDALFLDPHEGPGYRYPSVSVSLSAGSTVRVLTQARDDAGNTWVMADTGSMRVYLLQQDSLGQKLLNCDLSAVPAEPAELYSIWGCMVFDSVQMRFGPDTSYPMTGFTLDTDSDYTWVILVNGDWALVEFNNEYTEDAGDIPVYRRGWVPIDVLVY